MGYYINIVNSTAKIKKENFDKAYKVACDLNKRDDLKSGGSWANGKCVSKHFSWMDENYPETCKNIKEIIEALGFGTRIDEKGDLIIESYDDKTGDEEKFLEALAPFIEGEIHWSGEESEHWLITFKKGKLQKKEGTIVF
jgi:hypothetical protein